MLHQRRYVEVVLERMSPQEFSEPSLRAIYARLAAGEDPSVEELAAGLDEQAAEMLSELLADDQRLEDADRGVHDSLAALKVHRLEAKLHEIDRQLPLAKGTEQDELLVKKKQLTEEWRLLGGRRHKMVGETRV
jgi:hypothetical protein